MPWRVIREIALTVTAALGLLCTITAVVMVLFGIRPVVFMSGSMGPTIPTGSLGIIDDTPATEVEVGDIVSFIGPNNIRITHRVADLKPAGGSAVTFTTKGDANTSVDQKPITRTDIDVLTWSTPGWGYIVFWLQKPAVIFAGGAICGAWLTWWLLHRSSGRGRHTGDSDDTGDDRQFTPVDHSARQPDPHESVAASLDGPSV